MARYKNVQWRLPGNEHDANVNNDVVKQALLMDIRDELQTLNNVFRCSNFLSIPRVLKDIRARTGRIPTIRRSAPKRRKA